MIKPLGLNHIPEIAKIHSQELKSDFLPSLGEEFLRLLYEGVISKKTAFGYIAHEKGRIVGFIIGTNNMDKFFRSAISANFIKIIYLLILKILANPFLLKNIVETLFYTGKEVGPKAELVVIAVLKKWQGKGIGKRLVKSLENYFEKKNVKKYKLTVYADKTAINFYKKLKYLKLSEFNLYGKGWYIYEKKIS